MNTEVLTLTYQERFAPSEQEATFLDTLMTTFQKHKRQLWQALYGRPPSKRPTDLNAFKRDFCALHLVSSTAYNSLKGEVDALFKAQRELLVVRQVELAAKCQSLEAWLEDKEAMIERSLAKIGRLHPDHQQRLRLKLAETLASIHHKRRKLAACRRKLAKVKAALELGQDWAPSIAFGSKRLAKAQHHLAANGYRDHAEWKADYDFARSNAVVLVGDHGEKSRNREVKGAELLLLEPSAESLSLRLSVPQSMRAEFGGQSNFALSPIQLTPRSQQALREALSCVYLKKVQKNGVITFKPMQLPISFRFIRRRKSKSLKDGSKHQSVAYYLQFVVQKRVDTFVTTPDAGAIGIDQNLEHIAVGIIDRFGNALDSYSIPFCPADHTSEQNRALIGAICADVVDLAAALKLPLVVEKLDFKRKKATLKETYGAAVNHRFSAFAYTGFATALRTRAIKEQVQYIEVNPAYSSLISALNYFAMRERISSHEAACFTIARRGLHYRDFLNFGATKACKAPSALDEKPPPQRSELDEYLSSRPAGSKGHLWAFIAQKGVKPKFKDLAEFYSDGNSWLSREVHLGGQASPRRTACGYEALRSTA